MQFLTVSAVLMYIAAVAGVELTFELLDNDKQCFYETVPLNTSSVTLEFQVQFT